MGPSLSGLFAGGFPTLRPIGQRDAAGKTPGWCKMSFEMYFVVFSEHLTFEMTLCVCVFVRVSVAVELVSLPEASLEPPRASRYEHRL